MKIFSFLFPLSLVPNAFATPLKHANIEEAQQYVKLWNATADDDVFNCVVSTATTMWSGRYGVDTDPSLNLRGSFLTRSNECCLRHSDICVTASQAADRMKCHDSSCARTSAEKLFNDYSSIIYEPMVDQGLSLNWNPHQKEVLQNLPKYLPDILAKSKYHQLLSGHSQLIIRASGLVFFDVALLETPARAIAFSDSSKKICKELIRSRKIRGAAKAERKDRDQRQFQQDFQMWTAPAVEMSNEDDEESYEDN